MSSDERSNDPVDDASETTYVPEEAKTTASVLHRKWKGIMRAKVSRAARQPVGLKMLTGLTTAGSKYYAVQSKYSSQKALLNLEFRELRKIKSAIDKITYEEIEEPGVIPRTLAKLEDIMVRFNAEEQPRIEQIMDSVDGNLTESRGILNKVNTSFGNLLSFVGEHSLLIKIALAICGGGIALTLILIPLVLIKILIFGV